MGARTVDFLRIIKGYKPMMPKGILTGRATESEVASNATARVTMQRLVKDA